MSIYQPKPETQVVIWLLGAVGTVTHAESEITGWVKAFDPEAHDGRGDLTATLNRDEAKHFDGMQEALQFYRQQSKTRPYRDDLQPNRPLTAFTVEFQPVQPVQPIVKETK